MMKRVIYITDRVKVVLWTFYIFKAYFKEIKQPSSPAEVLKGACMMKRVIYNTERVIYNTERVKVVLWTFSIFKAYFKLISQQSSLCLRFCKYNIGFIRPF